MAEAAAAGVVAGVVAAANAAAGVAAVVAALRRCRGCSQTLISAREAEPHHDAPFDGAIAYNTLSPAATDAHMHAHTLVVPPPHSCLV